jgi:HK97 family phage portal protein
MILDGFINRRLAASGEVVTSPSIMTLDNPEAWRVPGLALELPASRAMKISAVSACIDIRSDSIGKMPFFVMDSKTKKRDEGHNLDDLLSTRPNRAMSPFVFKKLLETWRLMKGNAYVWTSRNSGDGRIDELIPLNPDLVQPVITETGDAIYVVTLTSGTRKLFKKDEIIHLKGFSDDGLIGQSVLTRASEVIAAASAQQTYETKFYTQGASPSGVVQVQSNLGKEAKDKIREEWERVYGGADNAFKVAVLDNGLEYKSIAMSLRDSQFVESRDLSVADIARFFMVPLYKLQAGKQTYQSNEQNAVEYVVSTLAPAVVQYEEEFTHVGLFDEEIRKGKVVKINMNAELRGDTESRVRWYKGMRDIGAYSPNEIRAYEDLPEVEGGDIRLAPLNMAPLDKIDEYFEYLISRGKVANQGGDITNAVTKD